MVDDKSETVEAAATPGWRSETIWKRTDQRRKPSGGGRFRNEVSKFSDRTETYVYRKQWKRQNYRGFKAFHFGLFCLTEDAIAILTAQSHLTNGIS